MEHGGHHHSSFSPLGGGLTAHRGTKNWIHFFQVKDHHRSCCNFTVSKQPGTPTSHSTPLLLSQASWGSVMPWAHSPLSPSVRCSSCLPAHHSELWAHFSLQGRTCPYCSHHPARNTAPVTSLLLNPVLVWSELVSVCLRATVHWANTPILLELAQGPLTQKSHCVEGPLSVSYLFQNIVITIFSASKRVPCLHAMLKTPEKST